MSIASKAVPVRFEGVSKIFGKDVVAVDTIDLHVDAGKLVTLLGPSGCGKTTTLRMIAGLEMASSGRILIGDRDVTKLPATDRDVSMVFQSYALFPHTQPLLQPSKSGSRVVEYPPRTVALSASTRPSGCPPWRPDQLRTSLRVGNPTPRRGTPSAWTGQVFGAVSLPPAA